MVRTLDCLSQTVLTDVNYNIQSAPKIIIQIAITGAQIFGRALLAAGRQAVKSMSYLFLSKWLSYNSIALLSRPDAQHRPQAIAGDAAGVGNATSSSATDQLTRAHKMTLDEARLILNMKREDSLAAALKVSFEETPVS